MGKNDYIDMMEMGILYFCYSYTIKEIAKMGKNKEEYVLNILCNCLKNKEIKNMVESINSTKEFMVS